MLVLFFVLCIFYGAFLRPLVVSVPVKGTTQVSHPNTAYGNMQEGALHSSILKL
jgi:hypothetical protein